MKKLVSGIMLALLLTSLFILGVKAYTNPSPGVTKEFFADAPHRIEPGNNIPLIAGVHDADQPLQSFTLQGIDVIDHKTGKTVRSYEYNEVIDDHLWYKVYYLDPNLFDHEDEIASIDVKFRIVLGLDKKVGPVDVRISLESLPKWTGWYAGDAHVHSSMTDNFYGVSGEFGAPVDAIASAARAIGLDWVIITDHSHDIDPFPGEWNTYKGYCDTETKPGEFICMLGEEITCQDVDDPPEPFESASHYLAYGISSPVYAPDWWGRDNNPTQQGAIDAVEAQGGIGFIAHPFVWNWDWENWAVRGYAGIEIWNSELDDSDGKAIQKWDELLKQGRKVFGIGNSDAHDLFNIARHVRNYVYIGDSDLTESNVIEAISKGHFIVTDGPLLSFTAENHLIGDAFTVSDDTVDLEVSWKSSSEYGAVRNIVVSINGEAVEFYQPTDEEKFEGTKSNWRFKLPSTGTSYFTVFCQTSNDRRAYTNPIWVNFYELNILTPTASEPAMAGDPSNPSDILVSVEWIPQYQLDPFFIKQPTFSVEINHQLAKVEHTDLFMRWLFGIYTLKVTPPTQPIEGLYDLSITATFEELIDSDTEPKSVKYVTAPPAEPIQKGLAWLRTRQYGDGSWQSNVGVTSLAALAFLNAGYDETDTTVSKAISYILGKVHSDGSIYTSYSVYETSTAIMALVATHNENYASIIENAKNWLVGAQQDEDFGYTPSNYQYGGWTYWSQRGDPDLSNTQFALLALDAANLPKTDPTWSKAIIFTQRCQNRPASNDQAWAQDSTRPSYNDGGFIYRPWGWSLAGGTTSYGSITGAGIWGLLLCGVPKTDERVVAAMNWVRSHYTWDTNPGIGWWRMFYYYLSMSKALTMYGEPVIDGHDWYQELYNKIVGMQIDAGSGKGYWSTSNEDYGPDLTTAYAILSLQTRAIAPPVQRLSYLTFILRSNCLLRITDPQGNAVGYNYMTGLGENQVPTAVYSGPLAEPQYVVIVNPQAGTYRLELIGISEGSYELTIQGNYGEEVTDTFTYQGEIKPAELHGTDVTVTAIVGPIDVYANPPEFQEIIDNIPPTTTLEIGEPKYVDITGNIYVSSVTPFTLTAEDNPGGTGVASTFYRISNSNDTSWIEYSAPFYLTGLSDGEYSIDYYSIDNIGNVEPTNTATVTLDNTPPITTLTIGEPKYVSCITYVTPDTPFILVAEDAGADVNATIYRIYNSTYDSGWIAYIGPFSLTTLTDGTYTIEYYSIDNVQNAEATQAINVTLFSWNYIFEDTYGRGTILKINLAHKFFQFITPDKDYGIRKATYMRQCGRALIIHHYDDELRLITTAVDTKLDFCVAIAWDTQTGKRYFLIDKAGTE